MIYPHRIMKKHLLKAIALIAAFIPAVASAQLLPAITSKVAGPEERPESGWEKMKRYEVFSSV